MSSECKYSLLEAKTKLEAYCAYQERCHLEIEQKLVSWGFFLEDRNAVIADLISNNFLNEERFASAYVSGKFRIKHWGKIKIKSHLKQKAVSVYSIQKGLEEIADEDYTKTIQQLVERKLKDLNKEKNTWNKRVKVTRYLQSKGYELELILEQLNGAM